MKATQRRRRLERKAPAAMDIALVQKEHDKAGVDSEHVFIIPGDEDLPPSEEAKLKDNEVVMGPVTRPSSTVHCSPFVASTALPLLRARRSAKSGSDSLLRCYA